MPLEFHDPDIETATAGERRRLEAWLLPRQLAYVYAQSPFYREKLDRAGVRPDAVTSRDALAALPFTQKSEIAGPQRDGPLFGPHQCARFEDIVRIIGTGGTSGQPTRIGWTRNDIEIYDETGARALRAAGCRPGDAVVNCFNYSVYAGGVMDHGAFEAAGAGILPYGVGKTDRLLDLISGLPRRDIPSALTLYATPSYAIRLAELARARGWDPRSLGLRKGVFSGEPGLQVPGYRARIEEAWGMVATDLYGLAEVGVLGGECEHRHGFHYSADGLVVAELIDPDSRAVRPMTDGASGELVLTTLRREACPLIRLRTHDTVRVYTKPCACGRTSLRFHVLGRSDDMFIVKGVNVFPLSVQETLVSHRPEVTGEFFIVLTRPPPIEEPPQVCVEVAGDVPTARYPSLKQELTAAIKQRSNFTPRVQLVRQGSIPSEHKTRRLYRAYAGQTPPSVERVDGTACATAPYDD